MADTVLGQFRQEVKKEKTSGRKLKFGIIGTGWIAEEHAEVLRMMDDVEVTCMADIIPGKAEKFCVDNGFDASKMHFYPSHKELIDSEKELDAVCVCTYNMAHKEPTVYALLHGVNVMLEKPMSVTLEEAEEMIAAEHKSGKILSVGFQPRMDANMQKIKKIVESGELGRVYYIQTGGGRRRGIPCSTFIEKKTAGVGALGDIGCYSLDMVLNAVGYPKPLTVSGYKSDYFGKNPEVLSEYDANRFDVDDFAAAFIRLEGGIVLDFRISWAMNLDTPGDTVILGTKGGLRIPSTQCWNGTTGGEMTIYKQVAGSQIEYKVPKEPNTGYAEKGLFYAKLASFADAVRTGGKAPVPTSQIYYNQAIIDGVIKSAELGREIEIRLKDYDSL